VFTRANTDEGIQYLLSKELPLRVSPVAAQIFQDKWSQFQVTENGELEHKDGRIVVPKEQVNQIIAQAYADPAQKGGRDKLYFRLYQKYIGISRRKVMEFIQKQETHQLHKPPHPKRINQPIVAARPFQRWQMDLIDMSSLAQCNNNDNWILTVIDVFTKHAWAVALKNKRGLTVTLALRNILLASQETPSLMHSDNGKEFKNTLMTGLLNKHKIKQLFGAPFKPSTQGCIERFNGTLKRMTFQHFTQFETKTWNKVLPKFVENQNTALHTTTGFTPRRLVQAYTEDDKKTLLAAQDNIIKKAKKSLARGGGQPLASLEKGDIVRIAARFVTHDDPTPRRRKPQIFRKGSLPNWSRRLFVVKTVSKPKGMSTPQYHLTLDEKMVARRFYREDLQKVQGDLEEDLRKINARVKSSVFVSFSHHVAKIR
jgi:hypothetical protein